MTYPVAFDAYRPRHSIGPPSEVSRPEARKVKVAPPSALPDPTDVYTAVTGSGRNARAANRIRGTSKSHDHRNRIALTLEHARNGYDIRTPAAFLQAPHNMNSTHLVPGFAMRQLNSVPADQFLFSPKEWFVHVNRLNRGVGEDAVEFPAVSFKRRQAGKPLTIPRADDGQPAAHPSARL